MTREASGLAASGLHFSVRLLPVGLLERGDDLARLRRAHAVAQIASRGPADEDGHERHALLSIGAANSARALYPSGPDHLRRMGI